MRKPVQSSKSIKILPITSFTPGEQWFLKVQVQSKLEIHSSTTGSLKFPFQPNAVGGLQRMASFKVPSNWGLCFAGNEEAFCRALDVAIQSTTERPFRYVEIGIGYGQTLNAVSAYLAQAGIDFELFGVDIPAFAGNAAEVSYYDCPSRIHLRLIGAERFFTDALTTGFKPNFIFIDGCHGEQCVVDDFMGAERIILSRGVIAFHDTDPGCQDIHPQPHCGTGIRARSAVNRLGLLDDSRKGWKKVDETSGNKDKGGHGCLFVQSC